MASMHTAESHGHDAKADELQVGAPEPQATTTKSAGRLSYSHNRRALVPSGLADH